GIGVKLQRLKQEDWIWIIYFFIVIGALLSNHFERKFLFSENGEDQKKFKLLNIAIFCVAFFIYLYFVLINYEDVMSLKREATKKEVITSHVALIAAILFLVGGALNIWVELNQDTPPEDVGLF
ncbi:MAG: hypothetical protein K2J20_02210, partial [Bacilli bacterium]|nr:hypothetical protein [Bacilli bacterium]